MTQKLRNSLQMIDTNKMKSKVTMTTPHIAFVPRFDDSYWKRINNQGVFLKLREQGCFMTSSLLSVLCRAAACDFCDSFIYTLIRQSDNVHTHRATGMPHLPDLIFQTIKEIKRVDYGQRVPEAECECVYARLDAKAVAADPAAQVLHAAAQNVKLVSSFVRALIQGCMQWKVWLLWP